MSAHERRFAVRMRNIRKARGMTQRQLAEAVGMMDRFQVGKIESGHRQTITIAEAVAISSALGVDVLEMLNDAPMALRVEVPVD